MRSIRFTLTALLLGVTANSNNASANVWTVTTTVDSGPGSLRAALDTSMATSARDTIVFNIPGAGPHTIAPSTLLPIITQNGVVIDGYTESGAAANTLASGDNAILKVILDPFGSLSPGLEITGDSCVVRGLVITGWGTGLSLTGAGTQSTVIQGNFIGVDATGTAAAPNSGPGIAISSNGNQIGGTSPTARNIISGNADGIVISSPGGSNTIEGNYIGTDRNGSIDVGNSGVGVYLGFTSNNFIGGTVAGSRNVISGNNNIGVQLVSTSTFNRIQGNYIGTDRTGTAPLGNGTFGVSAYDSPFNTIGGNAAAARNLISCNGNYNVALVNNGSTHNDIQNNYIGTDVSGMAALANPNGGIALVDADSNTIGGLAAFRNVISGMSGAAVYLQLSADVNVVSGNYIGVGSDGITPVGNGGAAILVTGSTRNTIGGYSGSGNVVAYATGPGVQIGGSAQYNQIVGNSIHDNSGLGIDLDPSGVNPNDPGDADTGPNGMQNFPVLTQAVNTPNGAFLLGNINDWPDTPVFVQVYESGSCDPSGYGEGYALLDTFSVITDGSGLALFARNLGPALPDTLHLTATATSSTGSTSEFSNCVQVLAAVNDTLQFFLFSPVHMVVTDPVGDSIGIDSATGIPFNTVLNGATYDTTVDINSASLTGPDGEPDDHVTIPHPIAGEYRVRLFLDSTASSGDRFTLALRIDGNQMLVPDDYANRDVTALGTTISNTVLWTAAPTLPGDCNADGVFNSSDIIFLVNYVFKGGPGTVVPGHGDVTCDGLVTSADIIRMVNFVFKSGLSPCSQSAG